MSALIETDTILAAGPTREVVGPDTPAAAEVVEELLVPATTAGGMHISNRAPRNGSTHRVSNNLQPRNTRLDVSLLQDNRPIDPAWAGLGWLVRLRLKARLDRDG